MRAVRTGREIVACDSSQGSSRKLRPISHGMSSWAYQCSRRSWWVDKRSSISGSIALRRSCVWLSAVKFDFSYGYGTTRLGILTTDYVDHPAMVQRCHDLRQHRGMTSSVQRSDIDWKALRLAASKAAASAYCPYSQFPVGAAGLTEDGRTVLGCNVENASYGLTLCAECGMISDLHLTGGGRLIAVVAVTKDGSPVAPCGRCRQLLFEVGGAEMLVDRPTGPMRLGDLLPESFGPDDLVD